MTVPVTSGRAGGPTDSRSWASVIDELKRDTARDEGLLADPFREELIAQYDALTKPWVPPEGLGSIPADLRTEAILALQRQLDVAERLASAIVVSRRQQQMADRIGGGVATPAPAFFDSVI